MANRSAIKDKKLYPHPDLAEYHPEPTILPKAEVLRRGPDDNQQMAAPLVRCGVLKNDPSVVVYMRVQESPTAEVNHAVQFVLAEPTKDEIKFDKHLAFDEKWTGEVGQWRSCADTADQELDAWKQYLIKVIGKNAPESDEIVRTRQTPTKESSPVEVEELPAENTEIVEEGRREEEDDEEEEEGEQEETEDGDNEIWDIEDHDKPFQYFEKHGHVPMDIEKWEKHILDETNFDDGEDSFDDLNDVDEEEDEEVAEERKNNARVRAHFAHIYPDLKTKIDAWDAFDLDTADPPFDTEDEDILTRISHCYVAAVPSIRGFPRPPNSMLRQALYEVRARAAPEVRQTQSYMMWKHGLSTEPSQSNVSHLGSYQGTTESLNEYLARYWTRLQNSKRT
ncbi:hypothetical protein KC340_g12449 [Hortaea werneckii]|nr:hypothetical protein KC342_g12744 [Hortaea werneckii]KAI7075205.1 hypothetical protein KC339_g13989 [Hortaea werneckii]KAI7225277.1 hypothetical protein KC365_g10077 [Hortaea werneckii]KAI7303575.1 hypothetical protein KC340_g12449 [Hortaea werneckii]KAI7383876.1 hypothetical protein KC328_g11068 [Hortaea werneckii]